MSDISVGNITCVEGKHNDEKIEFHFNPTEYSVTQGKPVQPGC